MQEARRSLPAVVPSSGRRYARSRYSSSAGSRLRFIARTHLDHLVLECVDRTGVCHLQRAWIVRVEESTSEDNKTSRPSRPIFHVSKSMSLRFCTSALGGMKLRKTISTQSFALHANIPLSLCKMTFIVIPIPAGVTKLFKLCGRMIHKFQYRQESRS